VGIAVLLSLSPAMSADKPAAPGRRALLERQQKTLELLDRAVAAAKSGDRAEFARLLESVAGGIEALAREASSPGETPNPITAADRDELKRVAADLRKRAQEAPAGFWADKPRHLLERVGQSLKAAGILGLSFQGSYSQTKVEEPVYGGHASAMGPPPAPAGTPKSPVASGPSAVQFEEVPGQLRVKTFCGGPTKDHIVESGGSGLALLDYDHDGLLDVYVASAFELDGRRERVPHRNALYRNLGRWKFEDVSAKAGVDVAAWSNGVCAGDFDADGLVDLYVTTWGPNLLFKNGGDGTFTEVAAAAGVQAGGWSTGCAFFDANGDLKLDLYVARYVTATWDEVVKAQRTMTWRGGPKVMLGPVGLPGAADVFYENRGDGTFSDATEERGLADAARSYGFGVVATDYDNDGWTDLFVANDSTPNFLYRNRGSGRFESVGLLSGVALNAEGRAQAGMGVDAGDYDNDGWMDLVLTTFAHDTKTLYRNLGNGHFEDASQAAGLTAATFEPMGWGTAFFDADLDGKLDLFIANGHIYPQVVDFPDLKETFRQRNQLLLNDGASFRDVSESAGSGLRVQRVGRGLAVGDLDNDGDQDLVVTNMDDVPTLLENRQRTGRHWIGVQLESPEANRFAIGARITLEAGDRRQSREVRSGGSYLSQNDLRAHFGVGSWAGPANVEVRLGEKHWRFAGIPQDRYTTLVLDDQARLVK
jgi:hypothetical protein